MFGSITHARENNHHDHSKSIPRYLFEFLLGHVDGDVDEVPDDLVHILAVEAHFGELRGLHLDKRGLGQLRDAPGNLRLCLRRRWCRVQVMVVKLYYDERKNKRAGGRRRVRLRSFTHSR